MRASTKNSRLALVIESEEGSPEAPAAGSDYVALQDGFSFDPAIEELENAELTGSIGQAKPTLGEEAPTASVSHYMRHSGVEGQEPNFGPLLHMAFGDKVVADQEYDTVAGSSAGDEDARASLNVDEGEGEHFERGQGVMVKDLANGYSIRPVHEVDDDALKLGFNLANAPAAGVGLGKAILYKPGTEHPTASAWLYRGNRAAVELIAGLRVLEASLEAQAGQFINGSFSLEGIEYFFNPITIGATNNKIDLLDEDMGDPLAATVASGTYKDPHDLAVAIEAALNALEGNTYTVRYIDSSGKFEIASDGDFLSLLWNDGANAANSIGTTVGYSSAANDTGATSYVGDDPISLTSPHDPAFDQESPLVAKANEIMLGEPHEFSVFSAQSLNFTLSNEKVDDGDITAVSGKSGSVIMGRNGQVDLVASLKPFEADRFRRFRQGQKTPFMWNFGRKAGGNWLPGKCGNLYIPTAVISAFRLGDSEGLVTLEMTLRPYVENGQGEMYLSFL